MPDAEALAAIDIATLVPHQGAMCLWQRVVAVDATTVTVATASHRGLDNPLRSDGRLRGLHLCEYGAQAMAVHGGLLAQMSGASAVSYTHLDVYKRQGIRHASSPCASPAAGR